MATTTVTTSTVNRRSTIKGVDTISPIPGNMIVFTPFHHKTGTPMVKTDVRIAAIISKVIRRFTVFTQG
jgi:predicted glycosyltransferase